MEPLFAHEEDPEIAKRLKERRAEELRREIADWRWLLKGETGRRILRRFLAKSGVYQATFNPDPHIHAFNAGRRDLGAEILALVMSVAPDQYRKMLEEKIEDE